MKYLIVSKTNNVTMCNFSFGKKKKSKQACKVNKQYKPLSW